MKKRAERNDIEAISQLGCEYRDGEMGLPQDYGKAMKLWLKAGELGCLEAYGKVANAYYNGQGVERDLMKAKHYWELASMGGNTIARHNLGVSENNAGNMDRAVKHWMISAAAGWDNSLKKIRRSFMNGHATKDFEKALRAHKEANDEVRSDQREAVLSGAK